MKYTIYYKVNGYKTLYKFPGEYIEANSEKEAYRKCYNGVAKVVEIMWEKKMTEMVIKKKRCQKDE